MTGTPRAAAMRLKNRATFWTLSFSRRRSQRHVSSRRPSPDTSVAAMWSALRSTARAPFAVSVHTGGSGSSYVAQSSTFPFASSFTHSALVVLATSLLSARLGSEVRRLVTCGAAIGLALHLVPDMFPEDWTGYALIHVPLLGKLTWVPLEGNWFPGAFSFCWLGGERRRRVLDRVKARCTVLEPSPPGVSACRGARVPPVVRRCSFEARGGFAIAVRVGSGDRGVPVTGT